jgi:hypothetical protein
MPDIGKDIRRPTPEDYRSRPIYPAYPGDALSVEDVHLMRMQAMQNSIPAVYLVPPPFMATPPEDIESPHWVSKARWRPYMFAILSPVILPLLLVYTLVRGVRQWGQFVGEITEGLTL